MRSKQSKGFTLVELMIIVAIVGIICAIAIPAFSRYVRKSRTAEVAGYLNKEWAGSVTYYMTDFSGSGGGVLPRQFPGPSGEWETKAANKFDCCEMPGGRCPGDAKIWSSDPVWLALKFSIPDSHSYLPGYSGTGAGTSASFTAYVRGNANCDAKIAQFARQGGVSSNGDVTGSSQPVVTAELE
jgi:prepilin-type N-terminal cleavage/methylation domain-containing protein